MQHEGMQFAGEQQQKMLCGHSQGRAFQGGLGVTSPLAAGPESE